MLPNVGGGSEREAEQEEDERSCFAIVRRHMSHTVEDRLQEAALLAREPRRQHERDASLVGRYSHAHLMHIPMSPFDIYIQTGMYS